MKDCSKSSGLELRKQISVLVLIDTSCVTLYKLFNISA